MIWRTSQLRPLWSPMEKNSGPRASGRCRCRRIRRSSRPWKHPSRVVRRGQYSSISARRSSSKAKRLHEAEEVIAHHDGERAPVRGQRRRVLLHTESQLAFDGCLVDGRVLVGHVGPFVDKRQIHLADQLAEPRNNVLELLGHVLRGHGLRQGAPRIGEVAQHHAFAAGQAVGGDEVGKTSWRARSCRAPPTSGKLELLRPGVALPEGVKGLVSSSLSGIG